MDRRARDRALGWAASHLGAPVRDAVALPDATTSTVLRLTDATGATSVLRLVTEEPWRTHGAGLVAREATVMGQLASTPVPAPHSIATDPDGEATGHPAHLMSHLPGRPDRGRVTAADLGELARVLAGIHAVRVDPAPRTYQPWAWEAKYVVPAWTRRPDVWSAAFTRLREPPPGHEPRFLHRDFQPRNVLWAEGGGTRISGVVDWVETSTGPAWLDVAHCTTNLALEHGEAVAAALATAYVERTGTAPAPWWDVLDVVGFLPRPGGAWFTHDPVRLERLEDRLVASLTAAGRG